MENSALEIWFFYGPHCKVCHDLWPKVQSLVEEKFPEIQLRYINSETHLEWAAQHQMLSVPGLIFLVEGKEHFRANGFLYLKQLEDKLTPAYNAYYQ